MSAVAGKPVLSSAMELSSDSLVVLAPRLVAADLGKEYIVLHLENGCYFGLENVSARIWELLQKPKRIVEIERALLEEYDVTPERCHAEVLRLLSDLIEQRLVEVKDS